MQKLKLFLDNWKTTIPGFLAIACVTDSQYLQMLPYEWEARAQAICTVLLAFGLIMAKDSDKTNSGTAGPSKTLSIMVLAFLMTGCAGTMLDGRVCTIATSDEVQQHVDNLVTSYVSEEKRSNAEKYLKGADLTATALCEMVRAREAAREAGK